MFRVFVVFGLLICSGCVMHNAPAMVRSQLKTDKEINAAIIEQIQAYKIETGQYPPSLSDLSIGEDLNAKMAKYERYTNLDKFGAKEHQFRYRIQTAWRVHGGHCIFDSHLNKWNCDDYPIEVDDSGNVHTLSLKRLDKSN